MMNMSVIKEVNCAECQSLNEVEFILDYKENTKGWNFRPIKELERCTSPLCRKHFVPVVIVEFATRKLTNYEERRKLKP